MYRHFFILFLIVFTSSSCVQAQEFKEGDYYVEIKGQASKGKEVTEFFSFYCPHCYRQEPFMNELQAALPTSTTFKKNHVDNMPGRSQEIEHALSKALITANILKVKPQVVPAIFEHIHAKDKDFSSVDDIKALFLAQGINGDKFDKTFKGFVVNSKFKQMQNKTAALRQQGIHQVPTLIINGKYMPVVDKLKSLEEYKQLVLYLLNKPA